MKTNIQRPISNATHRGWLHSTLSILRLRPLRAFTLLEVMLAIAIFSVVMGAMYATWRAIINATRASQYAAAEAQRVRVTLSSLEQSLTYTEKYVASGGLYWCDFKNGPDGYLTFVSNLPESFPRSGRFGGMQLRRVEFFIRRSNEGGNELALRQRAILREEYDKDEQEYPLVLLKNIKSMTTESWDEKKQDWTDEDWGDTNQIPKKVRMTIATENRKNPNDRGEEYIRIIRPASVGVQAGWQGSGGGGPPGTAQPPGTALPAPPVTR
jgi:prepilin-type N-terminal cleavage/methylation domain-containing protein